VVLADQGADDPPALDPGSDIDDVARPTQRGFLLHALVRTVPVFWVGGFERCDELGKLGVGDPAQLADLDAAELLCPEKVVHLVAAAGAFTLWASHPAASMPCPRIRSTSLRSRTRNATRRSICERTALWPMAFCVGRWVAAIKVTASARPSRAMESASPMASADTVTGPAGSTALVDADIPPGSLAEASEQPGGGQSAW
jgi:hypothetical protein